MHSLYPSLGVRKWSKDRLAFENQVQQDINPKGVVTLLTYFFSSSVAVNALWHGPNNDISGEKWGTQLDWPVQIKGQIITQNNKTTTKDDPQIPQPDLRFVSKATKQQGERGQAQHKTLKHDSP